MSRRPAARSAMRLGRRRALVIAMTLAVPLVVGVAGWRSLVEARRAVAGEVERTLIVNAEAQATDLAIETRRADRLVAAFAGSGPLVEAAVAGRTDDLAGQLAVFGLANEAVGVGTRLADGSVLDWGPEPPEDPRSPRRFRSVGDRTAARLTVAAPIRPPGGDPIGWVAIVLDVSSLSPQLVFPSEEYHGRTSLIGRDGMILMSSLRPPDGQVESDALLELLASGEAGVVTYDSVQLGTRRIAAVVPVQGTDVSIVVGVDAELASAPVAGLDRRLVVLLGATVLAVFVLLGAAFATVRGGRHQLERAQRAATHLAHVDELTGLANRRAFDDALSAVRGPVAVVMADLDRLKAINDDHGHAAGDAALVAAAAAITSAIRPGDLAARIGGDEFVVLLPGTTSGVAQEVGERIRHAIRQVQSPGPPLSASVGVAAGSAPEISQLLLGADAALYVDKAGHAGSRAAAPK